MEPENSLPCLQEPESPSLFVVFRDVLFSHTEQLLPPATTTNAHGHDWTSLTCGVAHVSTQTEINLIIASQTSPRFCNV
jgi:hypothetical protein